MARALRRGGPVVIVDDVRTTGATLEEVARLLEDLGARSPIAAVVAVVPSPSRRGQVDAGPEPPGRGASSDRELTAGGDL
jgi:adenine/guanine phosphoribosyltransferase-like PRPP-binding protein